MYPLFKVVHIATGIVHDVYAIYSTPGNYSLFLTWDGKCWSDIEPDGYVPYDGRLPAGSTHTSTSSTIEEVADHILGGGIIE